MHDSFNPCVKLWLTIMFSPDQCEFDDTNDEVDHCDGITALDETLVGETIPNHVSWPVSWTRLVGGLRNQLRTAYWNCSVVQPVLPQVSVKLVGHAANQLVWLMVKPLTFSIHVSSRWSSP